ncbi:MAG: hypothetical protein AAB676_17390 [Verrucomicrobiota bacterium]
MKAKPVIILLAIVSLGLGAGWYYRHQTAVTEKKTDTQTIQQLTNDLLQASTKLEEQQKVNYTLERELEAHAEEVKKFSNNLVSTTALLQQTKSDAAAAAQAAKAELAKRDTKITELESQRDDLTTKMDALSTSINGLQGKIAETEKKLAASEGDREFLLKELKRLQTEKSELERQFNDLAMLREQVSKLRAELSIARRLDWIRRGLYGGVMKGAERLQKGFVAPTVKTNYDLNVELTREGAVKVNPLRTNVPPATNAPVPPPAPAPAPPK